MLCLCYYHVLTWMENESPFVYLILKTFEGKSLAEDPVGFYRSLFCTHQYCRIVASIQKYKPELDLPVEIFHLFLASLIKIGKYEQCNEIASVHPLSTHPLVEYSIGCCLYKLFDINGARKHFTCAFIKDTTYMEPIHRIISRALLNNQSILSLFKSVSLSEGVVVSILNNNQLSNPKYSGYKHLSDRNSYELYIMATKLIKEEPDDFMAPYIAACHELSLLRYIPSRSLLMMCIERKPSFIPAWILFAYTFWKEAEIHMALDIFDIARRLFPTSNDLLLWGARFYTDLGDYESAIVQLCMCEKNLRTQHDIACVLYLKGERLKAVQMFIQMNDSGEDLDPICLINIANAFRRNKMYAEAIDALEKVDVERRSTQIYHFSYGFCLHLQENYREAIDHYIQFQRLHTKYSDEKLSDFVEQLITDASHMIASMKIDGCM